MGHYANFYCVHTLSSKVHTVHLKMHAIVANQTKLKSEVHTEPSWLYLFVCEFRNEVYLFKTCTVQRKINYNLFKDKFSRKHYDNQQLNNLFILNLRIFPKAFVKIKLPQNNKHLYRIGGVQ